ncbi:hypothetical protein RB195_025836 [Necator americanus]|uniref:Ion channel n=1 Tax=Necator americanus TaxID=51031 RepID=A0ABR1EUA6_NECAM
MSRRHPIRRYRPGLDEDQTRDAMKVLEKFVRKKYRNSVLVGTNDYDLNSSELLTPQPSSRPASGIQFPQFPSRQFTFDQSTVGQESRPPLVSTYTFDFTEHSVKDEIRFDKDNETKAAYISRVLRYFYEYLGLKHLALILILIFYALVGGFIFMVIELPAQQQADSDFIKDSKQRHSHLASFLLQSLYTSGCLKELRSKHDSETQIVHENSLCALTLRPLLKSYDESVRKALAPQIQWKWDYWNSVYYAGTIFTTIGYGNITCRTPVGRFVTILYALFGIPMMLAVLNVIGKALFGQAQTSYIFVRRLFRRRLRHLKRSRDMERSGTIETMTTDDTQGMKQNPVEDLSHVDETGLFETFPMSLAILLVFLYMFLCSFVFSIWEQWDFFTAVYFSFISMSTVGFGDVIPGHPRYACVFFAFYFVGLALFSMCYAIIQVRWENQYMWALQLIDQEHQDLIDHQEPTQEHEKEEKEQKSAVDNSSSIRWRSPHHENSDSDGEHIEELSSTDRNRCSTVLLDSKDLPVVPPPVLGVFLSRSISTRQKSTLTRSESALSRRVSRYSRNRKESPDSGGKPGTVAPGRTGLQESCRLPKRKRTRMAICTYNARTLASEAAIEDLMMQAKKIKYDVIGLTETRRRHPLNAVYETGEELFLGTCDSRGVGGVGVLVNTSMAKNIDSFEQLTTRIGRLRMRRCGPIPALTIFVVYAPTSSYEEEEVEAFYMDLEKFYQEDHAFYKVIVGDFNAKVGPRRTPEELHIGTHGLQWNDQGERLSEFIMTTKTIHGNSQFQKPSSLRWTWESPGGGYRNEIDHIIVNKRFCLTDVGVVPKFYTGSDHRLLRGRFSFTRRAEKAAKFRERNPRTTINWDLFATLAGFWEDSAMDNIDEEYDRLVEHLHDCAKKAESFKTTKSHVHLPPHYLREDGQVIPEVLPSEIRHAIMSVRNRTAPGPDRIRPEHLKSLPPVLINTLARLFTRYLSECKVPKQWKTSKTVLLYKREIHMTSATIAQSAYCPSSTSSLQDTIDHIHTVSKLIEVSREYKMPLCLTFIDLKKAFDSVETEAVVEALDNQGVPTLEYKATLENAVRKLEWDDMGVKVDGRQLHHLRFADDIVLVTPSISQAERMLTEFDETCGCIGLQLNLQKTIFMRNGWVSDAPFTLNGTNISECTSYVYLGRELNMMNDLTPELGRRRRAAWGAYKSIEDVVKKTRNTRLRAHLFNTTVLPALTYASETWAFRKQEENAVSVIERAIERVMLGVSRFTQVRDGIRSSLLRQRSKIRDAAAFAKESKIRWAGHVMRFDDNRWTRAVSDWVPRDIKRTTGRPPTRWSDFFTKSLKEKYDALRVPRERRNHWATLARDRDKWKNHWRPLDQFEDQRESRSFFSSTNSENLSPVENKSPWLSVSTDQFISPGPSGPRSTSSAASLSQRGVHGHKLSAINEVSDEDTLQSRRGSVMRKLQRYDAVEVETPLIERINIETESLEKLWPTDSPETTSLSPPEDDFGSDPSPESNRSLNPAKIDSSRDKATPSNR